MNPNDSVDLGSVDLIKRGESCINLAFRRTMGGLTLTVRTVPGVEDFFRGLSADAPVDVRGLGRYWTGLDPTQPLMAYNLAEPIPIIQLDQYKQARFDWLARQLVNGGSNDEPLRSTSGKTVQQVNMSFLRLVGIGESNGVTFRIKGLFSDDAALAMRDDVGIAAKKFYQTYMRPLNLSVAVVTQEW